MRGKQTAGGGAAGGPRRQVLVAASMDLAADVAAAVQARDVLEADGARAWTLGDLRRKGESDFDVQRRLLRHVADLDFDEVCFVGGWQRDPFCLLLLRLADFCGIDVLDENGQAMAVSFADHADCVEEPAEVCPDGKTIRLALSELANGTTPMPGVNRVRLVSAEGKVLVEGHYALHAKRMPSMDDKLTADDYEHYIVIDRFADWGMPREIGLMHLVDSGIGAYLEVVRGDM